MTASTPNRILVLNPGSTSTKLALYEDGTCLFDESISHSRQELSQFRRIIDQLEYRSALVDKFLSDRAIDVSSLAAVVGRGGLMQSIVSGTYRINEQMLEDLRVGLQGEHASNLAAHMAHTIAERAGVPCFVVDPVVVDELSPPARLSGVPEIPRKSIVHALNVKATARVAASELGKPLADTNLIVCHMGGGTSVCALQGGRMVDVSNALSAGPFTPERAGAVPTLELVEMCFSGEHTKDEVRRKLVGKGGLVGYLGTNDALEVETRAVGGDAKAKRVYDAMVYQIAKEIGGMAAVLGGTVDAIVLTGGLARSDYVVDMLRGHVGFIGGFILVPGGDEMRALAEGALRVLRGEERALEYPHPVEDADELV
ncbi:MAG: butyrate kinase [Candidatus Eisenbacteria bacterium]|nr:butyrate kinase [Candidatus Eisenbacteria bacterium]